MMGDFFGLSRRKFTDAELSVREICEAWVNAGMGGECFWEGWPECPTPYNSLTPNMVLDALDSE